MKAMALNLALVVTVVAGCNSLVQKQEVVVSGETWTSKMQKMSATLASLMQTSLDPVAFNSPENQKMIDNDLLRLSQFSHDVAAMKAKPSDDPGMEAVARQLSVDMQEARRQMQSGNRAYARHIIRNTADYCISCHTQTNRGPQFEFSDAPIMARLGHLDRSQFLFAVRQFDQGLEEFKKAMQSPDAALSPYATLESATLKALAVSVRVKQDPKMADSIINYIVQSKWAPVYLQISALKWREAVREWQKAEGKPKSLADAKLLITRAWRKQMESPLTRSGLVEQLRASAILHDLLKARKSGKAYAETLYYAGLTSEALKDLDVFNLSDNYYENCVRHLPRTETARNCYLRLESIIIANYSHFDSTPLPSDVRERLDRLKKLAETKDSSWSDWGERH